MAGRLVKSIELLYSVFAKYPAPDMTGSPLHADLASWNKKLLSIPLRELSPGDLSRFTGKAMTTWGSARDYKHFLPRIFELTAEWRTPSYDIWIAFDKLNLAEWNTWAEKEQQAVHEFLLALWESALNDNSKTAEWEFKEYFSAIAHFYPRFTDLLDVWTASKAKSAVKHLANFILNAHQILFYKFKIPGFYDQEENAHEFVDWILSDAILDKVQRAFFEFEKESFAEEISWAEQVIVTERGLRRCS